jgi:hypothetical protein
MHVAMLFCCLYSTAERWRWSVSMAAARNSRKASTAVMPWKSVLWIVHVSLAGVKRSTFPLVIVGVWLRRGCLRLSGIQVEMHVWDRVVVHMCCLLARSVSPYVAGENVGRVRTCAWGFLLGVSRLGRCQTRWVRHRERWYCVCPWRSRLSM